MQHSDAQIRDMSQHDLAMVRHWRNQPEVRRYMYNTHEISNDEHRQWFEKAIGDPSRKLLIVEDQTGPFGFAQFSGVRIGGVADWGFYVRSDAPRGSGTKLGNLVLEYAFTTLELSKICGQVVDGNLASLAFHKRMGFREERTLPEQQIIDEIRHNIICFSLLKTEWLTGSNYWKASSVGN